MKKLIKAMLAASLLVLSGNAAAIMMNDQLYGSSGYSLHDIDVAIQAFKDNISGKKDRKRLKKAYRLDRKVGRLIDKVDSARLSGKERKLRNKNRKLTKKEAKLLAILDGYLPNLDELLQDGSLLINSDIPPASDIPPLPLLDISVLDLGNTPGTGNPEDNTPGSTPTTFETLSEETESVPEPSMFALLGLGFAGLMFAGRRGRYSPLVHCIARIPESVRCR
jgi:hypothetical protein